MESQNYCHHLQPSGALCGAVPVRGRDYCYFHLASRERQRRRRRAASNGHVLEIGLLESRAAIQLAIGDLINAVLAGTISCRQGYLILGALQTAARNAQQEGLFTPTPAENKISQELQLDPAELETTAEIDLRCDPEDPPLTIFDPNPDRRSIPSYGFFAPPKLQPQPDDRALGSGDVHVADPA